MWKLTFLTIIFTFFNTQTQAQNLVCSNNGYQNIVRSGNNNNNTQGVLILKISNPFIYAEYSGLIEKKMLQSNYKIVSENKDSISAYEVPVYEGAFSISSISINIKENIATTVTANPYGASVTLYSCNSR